jgi:nucleotide-binding universal stress UspA family protein
MLHIKKILFPTDFTMCAHQALEHALHLAKDHRAEIHMLHALVLHGMIHDNPNFRSIDVEEVEQHIEATADTRMHSALAERSLDNLVVKRVKKRGISAAPVIVEYARDLDIDLIVMGTHGRRTLGRLFLGSVAEEVVRTASCPVLTVRERSKTSKPVEIVNKILVPVDFSTHSKRAVSYARELASSYDARLQLLHVVERAVYPSFYALDKKNFLTLLQDVEETAMDNLRRLFDDSGGPHISAEFHLIEGRAVTAIPDFADSNDTDLIVIATHGLTGIDRLFLGSVAEKVIRRAGCPVFVVKAFGRSLIREDIR